MTIRLCVAGATGWVGRALVPAILEADDLTLAGAVARKSAGRDLGAALGRADLGLVIAPSIAAALRAPADVLIDYTAPASVKEHVLAAIERGAGVVVGTSGLTAADYDEIDVQARERGVGVVGSGNFTLTAALMQHFATIAAAHVPHWEVLDYARAEKADVPSGTARELAERLGSVGKPRPGVALDALRGPKETRGAEIAGVRVHSMRLPGYVLAVEAIFGLAGERLTIRHDAGESAEPYVAGTLLAARKAPHLKGVVRGLDRLLFDA